METQQRQLLLLRRYQQQRGWPHWHCKILWCTFAVRMCVQEAFSFLVLQSGYPGLNKWQISAVEWNPDYIRTHSLLPISLDFQSFISLYITLFQKLSFCPNCSFECMQCWYSLQDSGNLNFPALFLLCSCPAKSTGKYEISKISVWILDKHWTLRIVWIFLGPFWEEFSPMILDVILDGNFLKKCPRIKVAWHWHGMHLVSANLILNPRIVVGVWGTFVRPPERKHRKQIHATFICIGIGK